MKSTTTYSAKNSPPETSGDAALVRPQSFTGVVVKTAMKDTATVQVDRFVAHPKYKKYQVRSKKFLVHDAGNTAQVGDTVTIVSVKPISKLKRFAIKK